MTRNQRQNISYLSLERGCLSPARKLRYISMLRGFHDLWLGKQFRGICSLKCSHVDRVRKTTWKSLGISHVLQSFMQRATSNFQTKDSKFHFLFPLEKFFESRYSCQPEITAVHEIPSNKCLEFLAGYKMSLWTLKVQANCKFLLRPPFLNHTHMAGRMASNPPCHFQ